MQTFPNIVARFIGNGGNIIKPWIQYLQQFTIAPPKFIDVSVGSSPFSYTAKEPGYVYYVGGVVTGISLTRGSDTLPVITGVQQFIPVSIGDTVTFTYTGLPAIIFIPIYGANVTS